MTMLGSIAFGSVEVRDRPASNQWYKTTRTYDGRTCYTELKKRYETERAQMTKLKVRGGDKRAAQAIGHIKGMEFPIDHSRHYAHLCWMDAFIGNRHLALQPYCFANGPRSDVRIPGAMVEAHPSEVKEYDPSGMMIRRIVLKWTKLEMR